MFVLLHTFQVGRATLMLSEVFNISYRHEHPGSDTMPVTVSMTQTSRSGVQSQMT